MCCQYSRNEGEVKGHVLSAAEAVNSCTQPVFKAALLSLHNREVAGRDFIRLKAKTMSNSKPRLRRHKTTTLRSNSPNYTRNNQRALILAWKNITKVAASLFIPFETTAFNYSWSVQLSAHSMLCPEPSIEQEFPQLSTVIMGLVLAEMIYNTIWLSTLVYLFKAKKTLYTDSQHRPCTQNNFTMRCCSHKWLRVVWA